MQNSSSSLIHCVHVTALLFTLAEVSPAACTSLPCAWSRPSAVGGISAQSSTLDFGKASSEGYLPHSGPPLDVRDLLRAYEMEEQVWVCMFNRRKTDAEL